MAKFGLLLLCAVLLHTGYALQCYNCVSSAGNKNCDDLAEKEKVAVAICGKTVASGYAPGCIKKVIQDKTTNVQNTTRACILTKAGATAHECDAPSDRINVLACEICSDDLCNSADKAQFGIFALAGSAVAFFVINRLH